MAEQTSAVGVDPKTARVSRMFGRIAHRYDLMNRLMSVGQDQAWRSLTARLATEKGAHLALDVATGTADLAIALKERGCRVVGLDPSDGMLRLGRAKLRHRAASGAIGLIRGDAHDLPFSGDAFDCVTVAFGVRNMGDPVAALAEMHRVLVPGGRLACLEIMRPRPGAAGRCYHLYLNRFIPWLGGRVSGQPDAYEYLSSSVMGFQDPEGLKALMQTAGFRSVTYRLLNLGTLSVHVAEKR